VARLEGRGSADSAVNLKTKRRKRYIFRIQTRNDDRHSKHAKKKGLLSGGLSWHTSYNPGGRHAVMYWERKEETDAVANGNLRVREGEFRI